MPGPRPLVSAAIPGGSRLAAAEGMIVRTALEDATLQRDLPGYAEYASKTRYRLCSGVW